MKSDQVKLTQNIENPTVSPVLSNQFHFESISLISYIFCLVWPPIPDFQYENLRISLNAMIGAKNIRENLAISRRAAKRQKFLFKSQIYFLHSMLACT